jgi:glucose/arabinose dehydrogenase
MRTLLVHLLVLLAASSCHAAEQAGKIKLERVVSGLREPLYLTHDGTDRIFIVEQAGRIRLFDKGVLQKEPFLDIASRVTSGGECGLLGLAFHPDFARNGYFYVNYTARRQKLTTVISEFRVDPGRLRVNPATERVILTISQPYPNHNGGQLCFGPDGMLYIGVGDGGSAADPQNHAQNPASLLGKILRIDVNTRDGYLVPADNPFVNRRGFRGEIWAWGLRNPWRFSFDRQTDICYCGDVGQNLWEEIDIIEKGGNYGWRFREGSHKFRNDPNPPPDLIDPIKEYHHDLGLSVTGGYVYRGKASPSLAGWYIYADYSSGRIWGLKYENDRVIADELLLHGRTQPASFGEDAAGEVYLCDYGGTIYRIVAD